MRNLDTVCPERDRETADARYAIDIASVNDGVDCQGKIELDHVPRKGELLIVRTLQLRDGIRTSSIGGLDGELHVVQAYLGETAQLLHCRGHAGGNQVGIEADFRAMCRDGVNVGSRCWLTAREVDMKHAKRGSLAEHATPCRGVEF